MRFQEGAQTDVVLKFNRWNCIHVLRPDLREDGYLRILDRAEVAKELQNPRLKHDLAVVIFGFLFPPDIEAINAADWREFLLAQGFKRVVVVRIGAYPTVDGMPVVMDTGAVSLSSNTRPGSTAPHAPK